jgi:hypothetical protein
MNVTNLFGIYKFGINMSGVAKILLRNSFAQKVYLLSAVIFLSILCLNNDYQLP